MRADRLASGVAESAWERCSAGDGAKGPRVYDWAAVNIRPLRELGKGHWLLTRRSIASLVSWPTTLLPVRRTKLEELVAVQGPLGHRGVPFERQGRGGLDQYEVRRWDGCTATSPRDVAQATGGNSGIMGWNREKGGHLRSA